MKNIFLLMLVLLYSIQSYSQTNEISLKIIDEQSQNPLAGANVSVNNSFLVVTNQNGEAAITCSDTVNLTVSFVGYKTISKSLLCTQKQSFVIALKPDSRELGTIEVTAKSNPEKSQLEQPVSIVKMEEKELKRSTGLYLDDAINTNVPGVSMQRRSQSGGQQINIRGYGSGMGIRGINNNFDGQGVKVYLNGIPVTDAEGITVMDDIDFGSVSGVEILKGPSGTLYGLAISGVVNMKTEIAPESKISVGQEVLAGSYGLFRSTSRISIGDKNSSLLLNYGNQKFDGYMDHTKSKKDFVNMIGEFRLGEKQRFTSYLGYANSYDERNGELTTTQYETFDYSGNPRYIKNDAHSAVKTIRAGIGYSYSFSKSFSFSTTLFGSSQMFDNSSAGGWTDKSSLNYGFRSVFENKLKLSRNISLTGITGIEAQRMHGQTTGYGMGADSTNLLGYNVITNVKSNQSTKNGTYSIFTQWTLQLPMKISITAGVGLSNMNISLEDRLWGLTNNHPSNTKQRIYENEYSGLLSPTVAINKKIGNSASVYVSYSTGYKAPVAANVLISTTGEMNTSLQPEKGSQIEIGTKGSLLDHKLFYTIAAFNVKYENKFTTVAVPNPNNTVTLYSYLVNGGRLNNSGLEIYLSYKVIDKPTGFLKLVQPFANLAYSDFRYEDFYYEKIGKNTSNQDSLLVEDYSGKSVAGVSPVVFNLGIDVESNTGFYASVYLNYKSSMPFTSDGMNETNAYTLLNAKLGFRKKIKHFDLDIYGGLNNITGTQYYNMVFVNQLPDAYIPAPNEINFFGGLNLRYNF